MGEPCGEGGRQRGRRGEGAMRHLVIAAIMLLGALVLVSTIAGYLEMLATRP